MAKIGLKAEAAREFRDKHGMEMPTLQAARMLYKESNKLFTNVEDARNVLRYIEGKTGKVKRQHTKDTKYYRDGERPRNPYKLPESDAEPYIPYQIKGFMRGLIINDLHFPFQDNDAITATFDFAKKEKPDFVFINGDALDVHGLSHFLKDPRKKDFVTELSIFKQFFDVLKKTFNCRIFFKFGNHEERYQHYLWQKAKEITGLEEFELSNIIKARAEGIEIIENKRLVVLNGLPFVHGHEFGRQIFSPVNAARGLMLKAKHSAVKGDCHNTSEHNTKDVFGKFMTTWSVGCLCGLTPQWLPINEWNHGFAIIDLDGNGQEYNFRNYRILNGKVL